MTTAHVSARAIRGELKLRAVATDAGTTVLAKRHAAGAFHLSKPYWDDHALMVQWINPTAGIFAGDVLESDVTVESGAALLLTTPSATRIHTRASPGTPPGEQHQSFQVAGNGSLEVQPEWLIPQRDSAFVQNTSIHVGSGGMLFYVELVAPGRVAHGEWLAFDLLDLRLRLFVCGELVVQDRLHAAAPAGRWMLKSPDGSALFYGSVLVVLPGFQSAAMHALKAAISGLGACAIGITSLSHDVIAIRVVANEGMILKKAIHLMRGALAPLCRPLNCALRKL